MSDEDKSAVVVAHLSSEVAWVLWELAQKEKTENGDWSFYMKLLHARYVILQSELDVRSGSEARELLGVHAEAARAVDEFLFGDKVQEICRRLREEICRLNGISSSATDAELKSAVKQFNLRNHPDKGQTNPARIADFIQNRKLMEMLKEFSLPSSIRKIDCAYTTMMAWMGPPMPVTNRGNLDNELRGQRAQPHCFVLVFSSEFLDEVAAVQRVVGEVGSSVAAALVFLYELDIILRREGLSLEFVASVAHVLLRKLPLLVLRKLIPAFWHVNLKPSMFIEFAVNSKLPLHRDFSHSMDYIAEWLAFTYKYLPVTVSTDLGVRYGVGGISRLELYNAFSADTDRCHPKGLSTINLLPPRGMADDLDDWMVKEFDKKIHRYMKLQKRTDDYGHLHPPHRCNFAWEEGERQFPGAARPECRNVWFTPEELWNHCLEVHWADTDVPNMARCRLCRAPYPSVEDAVLQRHLELAHLVECRMYSRHYLPTWQPEPHNRHPFLMGQLRKYSIPPDVVQEIHGIRNFRLTPPAKCVDATGHGFIVLSIKNA